MPLFASAVETSDQRVSLRRSSNGKSNRVASICVVNSIETRSTKLKVSLRGSESSTLQVRLRIRIASSSRCVGVNIGCTVLRCAECRGWSIAMKLGQSYPGGTSRIEIPPSETSEEKMPWLVSTCMMSLYLVTDQ